ncbi:MAG: tetratricopeptide repeat protein [Candidatus Heimdallarchaeota archaeon]|nr:tetratricopeptide repeat protein [Candidatus Heimdallarchaeota archaeon]
MPEYSSFLTDLQLAIQNKDEETAVRIIENVIDDELLADEQLINFIEIASEYYRRNKMFARASELLQKGISLTNVEMQLANLHAKLANIHFLNSNYEEAFNSFKISNEIFVDSYNFPGSMSSAIKLAEICIIQGEFSRAFDYIDSAIIKQDSTGDKTFERELILLQTTAFFKMGEIDEAEKCLYENDHLFDTANKRNKSLFNYLRGEIYDLRGNLHKAMQFNTAAKELRESLGDKRLIGVSTMKMADLYQKMGELNLSETTHLEALDLFKEERDLYQIALAYTNLGTVLYKKGELVKSLEYLHESLDLMAKLGIRDKKGDIYNFIGEIYYNQKNFEQAIKYQNLSIAAYRSMNDNINIVNAYFSLMNVGLAISDSGLQESMMKQIEDLYRQDVNNLKIDLYHKISKALVLKQSGRRYKIGQAELILNDIINATLVEHKIIILAMQQKAALLLDELSSTGAEDEILKELIELIDKLDIIAMNQNSSIIQVETSILNSILSLLQGDLVVAESLFDQAEMLAESKNLTFIIDKLKRIRELYNSDFDEWEKISSLKIPIKEKLRFNSVYRMLESTKKSLFDPFADPISEDPKLLLIITKAGLVFFSYKFDNSVIEEHLIAAFLTAINSFANDAFQTSGTLETIKHQNYSITQIQQETLNYYYVYENISNNASKKLREFISYFGNDFKDYLAATKSKINIIPNIQLTEKQGEHIRAIFLS